MAIKLGNTVTDVITGVSGTAMSRTTFLHGCVRVSIQPTKLIDGKQQEKVWLDEQQLKENDPATTLGNHSLLGKTVTDSISGYKGIAIARTEYLYGCPRIAIQAKGLHEGKPVETYDVDEPQLKEYKEPIKSKSPKRTGGPGDFPKARATAPQRSMATR